MRSFTLLILSICLSFFAPAQDLTGTWEGRIEGKEYAKLCVVRYKDSYVGYTYDEGSGFCKAHFTGHFNDRKLKGMNPSFIDRTPNHILSRYNLEYSKVDEKEYLSGTISGNSAVGILLSLGTASGITYTRTSKKTDTTAYMRNWLTERMPIAQVEPAPVKPSTRSEPPKVMTDTASIKPIVAVPARIDSIKTMTTAPVSTVLATSNKRITDTLSIIDIHEKELVIKVMDNGIVDGDTISIIHNGQVIAEKLSVTAKPYEIKIPVSQENDRHEIILVAHNLGSISPNTALILIETPTQRYRLTASTDLHKNAMIIFRYKAP